MSARRISFFICILLAGFLAVPEGRAFTLSKDDRREANLTNHVIRADQDGMALDLTLAKPRPFDSVGEYRAYIKNILDAADKHFSNAPMVKLLIHVHGGLNTETHTKKRLKSIVPAILGDREFYPILLSWPSGPLDTYGETLVGVRRGRSISPWIGWSTMPFVLAADLSQSAAKLPMNWFYQAFNSQQRIASERAPRFMSDLNKVADVKVELYPETNIELSQYYYGSTERVWRIPLDTVTFAPRVSVGTLMQSSIAEQAWKNMKRRTLNVFEPAPLFNLPPRKLPKSEYANYYRDIKDRSAGAFFAALNERIAARAGTKPVEITFVGHSMGALVLNHLFTQQRNTFLTNGALKNIVYMAAACSVNDGLQALTPLLVGYNAKLGAGEEKLHFYNLTLNRIAELAERPAWGLAPTGSLLEYIDQHLESPDSILDRTLGSEINVLASLEAFRPVWKYTTFKSFDRVYGHIPEAHGDFNKADFWRKEFWSIQKERGVSEVDAKRAVNSTEQNNAAQSQIEKRAD